MKYLLPILVLISHTIFIGCSSDDDNDPTFLTTTSSSIVDEVNCCPFSSDPDNTNPGSRILHSATFEGSGYVEISSVSIDYVFESGSSNTSEVNSFDVNYTSQSVPVIGSAGRGTSSGTVDFSFLWKFSGSESFDLTINLTTNQGVISSTHTINRPPGAN
ncbi:MAG: hypothetical protein RH860_06250 [Cytophagales bacterium]